MKYCSIIICHFGQRDILRDAESRNEIMRDSLRSLAENTDYPAEIIVMDNGGNPDDSEYLLNLTRDGSISTYVRYHDNMSFGFAWNQGYRLASGDYICFTCNDIYYEKGWLSNCINLLEKYSDRKLIAAPYITPDKNFPKWNKEVLPDARINTLAGSNCMIMRPETFLDIGQMPHYRIGGTVWHRIMVSKEYMVIVPPKNMVRHLSYRNGVRWQVPIDVSKTLLNKERVDFNYKTIRKSIYGGLQKQPGVKL